MKAAVLYTFGESPRYDEVPMPEPGDGEEIISVLASPLTNVDRNQATGTHATSSASLPVVCGTVGVGERTDGSRVIFGVKSGAMAEWARTAIGEGVVIPEGLDAALAVAARSPGVSALMNLRVRANLQAGETVLVLGATGVTGKLTVQIAKLLGAGRVVAAGRNEAALASLLHLGAESTVQLANSDDQLHSDLVEHAGERGYDIVIDYLWGHPTEVLMGALVDGGLNRRSAPTRLVEVGAVVAPTLSLPASALRGSGLQILGTGLRTNDDARLQRECTHELLGYLKDGALQMEINRIPLSEVQSAWGLDQTGLRTVFVV